MEMFYCNIEDNCLKTKSMVVDQKIEIKEKACRRVAVEKLVTSTKNKGVSLRIAKDNLKRAKKYENFRKITEKQGETWELPQRARIKWEENCWDQAP